MPAENAERRHGFDLQARLQRREQEGLRRDLQPIESVEPRTRRAPDPGNSVPDFDSKEAEETVVFAANDYLGLAGDTRLAEAASRTANEVGVGAGASRLVVGDTPTHRELEQSLARTKGTERAVVFSSGYAANVGTISALSPDVIFSDELNHASIIDGCRLSGADIEIYDHCTVTDLRQAFQRRSQMADSEESWLVVTDTIFSMDGDVAPLAEVCAAAHEYGAWVMVDEAHATGVYNGGIVGKLGLEEQVQVQLGTLSKALAAQGGFVAGSEALVEYLINTARSFVFSTGLAPPVASAAQEALRIAHETNKPDQLHENAMYLRKEITNLGFEVLGETHILPVLVGDRKDATALADRLREQGILAPAIRPPTVEEGTSRIRVAASASHSRAELGQCIAAFETAGKEIGLL